MSSAIRTLEDRYGAMLFNRIGRRIELTGDGRIFSMKRGQHWRERNRQSVCYLSLAAANVVFLPSMPANHCKLLATALPGAVSRGIPDD